MKINYCTCLNGYESDECISYPHILMVIFNTKKREIFYLSSSKFVKEISFNSQRRLLFAQIFKVNNHCQTCLVKSILYSTVKGCCLHVPKDVFHCGSAHFSTRRSCYKQIFFSIVLPLLQQRCNIFSIWGFNLFRLKSKGFGFFQFEEILSGACDWSLLKGMKTFLSAKKKQLLIIWFIMITT